jgi:Protein of unknown function (DUF3553)
MTRKTASAASRAPRFVQHPKRPAWGVGQILDEQHGVVRVAFADGVTRSFRGDVLEVAETPENPPPIPTVDDAAIAAPKRARKPARVVKAART